MCHHRTTERTRLYEDGEHETLPEWAVEADDEGEEDDSEPEPFAPGTAD